MTPHDTSTLALEQTIAKFLAALDQANHSSHTLRAYGSDLRALAAFSPGPITHIDANVLRDFLAQYRHLQPATRSRKMAALASFFKWAFKQDLIDTNPMLRIDRVKVEPSAIQPISRKQFETILKVIPPEKKRDRLIFRLLFETGLRISEALGLYVEDVDLSLDDERITVLGKGDRRRTILLDDHTLVEELRSYIKETGYKNGPLFRAHKHYRGGALRYSSIRAHWTSYCEEAGISCTFHQLRQGHATELINGNVSLATIRKRLGHKNLQTTLRYAQLSDETADTEIRSWRRNLDQQRK